MPDRDLDQWLRWQQGLNAAGIELGLDRVRAVGQRLGVLDPAVPVITVAGTNGKGSVVAYLEAILRAAGYRTGAYTSPHLLRYNERIRIGGREATDDTLIDAFERVEAVRADTPLTYFEFGTLAALQVFREADVQVLVLEVGLGGRLDAVNAVEPSVAVITSIGLDHADWLGGTLEAVAGEKAGILRPARPAVFGGRAMPAPIAERAAVLGAPLYRLGEAFGWVRDGAVWTWWHGDASLGGLPAPGIPGARQWDNAAAALSALKLLSVELPVSRAATEAGLGNAAIAGRCQHLRGPVEWVLDVAHNADAAQALAEHLAEDPTPGRRWALFGAMARKDLQGLLTPLKGLFDGWYLMHPAADGAWPLDGLREALERVEPEAEIRFAGDTAAAMAAVAGDARPGDRVVAFGSFHVVEAVLGHRLAGE